MAVVSRLTVPLRCMYKKKLQPLHLQQSTITKIIVSMSPTITKRNGATGTMMIARVVSGFQTDGTKNTVNGTTITAGNITEVFSLLS